MSKKLYYMRDKDIDIVNENVDNIIEKARNKEIQIIEPTIDEFKKVKSVILDFIRKEKRIIYGGYAWNQLVKKKSPDQTFYTDSDYTDVEFYSNTPIEDLVKLCNILSSKGFKYIQGKSAQHDETYTIFVNFNGYCDITYMPSNIYYTVMTETINGLRLIHPKFILVDLLRQFTDPITSFRRLDKNIKRGKLIMKNYPLILEDAKITLSNLNKSIHNLINNLLPEIIKLQNIIFIGQIAFDTFLNPNINMKSQKTIYNHSPIEFISTNLRHDVKLIYNLIVKYFLTFEKNNNFNDTILLNQYHPYFQFTDKKAVFKYNGEIFLTIYGNNERCNPYHEISLEHNNKSFPIKIATFNLLFMYNLIKYHYAITFKDKESKKTQDHIMYQLLISRDNFLNSNNKTVIDNTIFEDFTITCVGVPESSMRKFMLSRRDRKLMPRSAIHPYDPDEKKDNFPFDSYYFNNTSGNIINNPKDLIYNPKHE
jgi:hypothetical protein